MLVPVALGAILAVAHYFSEKFHLLRSIQQMKAISFAGGVFITYLILHILPDIFSGSLYLHRVALVFVLAGFSIFHLGEKYVCQREFRSQEGLKWELKELHSIAFFIYHFIIGIVLMGIIGIMGLGEGVLFFIPLFLIAAMSSLSLKGLHGRIRQKRTVKLLLSASTLLGILAAATFPLTALLHSILLGFVMGTILFIVIVDSIPRERKGEPIFFILGVALYGLLIGATWLL